MNAANVVTSFPSWRRSATRGGSGFEVSLDGKGFVKTGVDRHAPGTGPGGPQDVPLSLETTCQGGFAIGDVRFGSVKPVFGGAIGEGAASGGPSPLLPAGWTEQSRSVKPDRRALP